MVFDIPNFMYWHLFPFHSSGPRWRICRSLVGQLKSWVTWHWLDFRNNQERAAGCYTLRLASLHSDRSSSYKSRSPSDAHQGNTLRRIRKWRIFRQYSHCPHVDQMNIRSTLAQCRVEIKMHFITVLINFSARYTCDQSAERVQQSVKYLMGKQGSMTNGRFLTPCQENRK